MTPIINTYNVGGIDQSALKGTGSGGILSERYLRSEPLSAHLEDGEQPVILRLNAKKGVVRSAVDSEETDRIAPGDGYRAFALATDARLLIVVCDTDGDD